MKSIMKLSFLIVLVLLFVSACGGSSEETPVNEELVVEEPTETAAPVGDATAGAETYASLCAACHGPDARGLEGLGQDLVESEYVSSKSDAELFEFITTGRSVTDPDNETGIDMPPKGGNPALSDDEINNIVAYLRELQGE